MWSSLDSTPTRNVIYVRKLINTRPYELHTVQQKHVKINYMGLVLVHNLIFCYMSLSGLGFAYYYYMHVHHYSKPNQAGFVTRSVALIGSKYVLSKYTVEHFYNKLLHNKYLDITKQWSQPCATVPHGKLFWYDKFLLITNSLTRNFWFVISVFHCMSRVH